MVNRVAIRVLYITSKPLLGPLHHIQPFAFLDHTGLFVHEYKIIFITAFHESHETSTEPTQNQYP